MKRIVMALALTLGVACAGKPKYGVTEGPFRAEFARPISFAMVNQPWSLPILLKGVLPSQDVHIEMWLHNNGTEELKGHSDVPGLYRRVFQIAGLFTQKDYCLSIGKPLDQYDPGNAFWNRGTEQLDSLPPIDEDSVANGRVEVRVKYFELDTGQSPPEPGKLLSEAKTKVQLQCPQCRCGNQMY